MVRPNKTQRSGKGVDEESANGVWGNGLWTVNILVGHIQKPARGIHCKIEIAGYNWKRTERAQSAGNNINGTSFPCGGGKMADP